MAGPVFHRDDFRDAAQTFPAVLRRKAVHLRIHAPLDHGRDHGRRRAISSSIERFMPSTKFSAPIDMEFGPNGDLYLLEYGTAWFQGNADARLVRIEYNAGNREADRRGRSRQAGRRAAAARRSSPRPARWTSTTTRCATRGRSRGRRRCVQRLTEPNPSFTFTQPGTYTASLDRDRSHGARSTAQCTIVAGNEPPKVDIDLVGGNKIVLLPRRPGALRGDA